MPATRRPVAAARRIRVIIAFTPRRPPRFLAAVFTGLIAACTLAPFVSIVSAATTVTPATGGGAISADTAATAPGAAYTVLTGPTVVVTHPGGLASGTITLAVPAGFAFDPSARPTVNGAGTGLVATCGTPTITAVTCTVTTPSSVDGSVTFAGIGVRPTARTPLASGTIAVGGTAGLVGSGATLTEVAGTPTKLAYSTQPGGGPGWVAFATQPLIAVEDAAGNTVVPSGANVSLTIATNPGGGTLTCGGTGAGGRTLAAAGGVAAFVGCQIDKAASGYTIVASSAGLASATSLSFNVTPAQNGLAFTILPGGGAAATAFATQPVIAVQDPGGTTDTTSTASVTLQLGANPSGGTLTCAGGLSKAAAAGTATFSGCKIDKPGNGYTMTATATALTGVTSPPFNVLPGAASKLVFSTQPGGASAGVAISPQPVVTIQDPSGNTVTTSSASITLAIAAGTGTPGATLSCTGGNSLAAVAGVASFSGCSISRAGNGYKLVATTSGLASITSSSTTINPAPPTQIVITTQPSAASGAATAFAAQAVFAIRDATGQTVTTSTLAVTLSIAAGTGTGGATLACTGGVTKAAAAGIAAFSGCNIDKLGSGYTLLATATGLMSATTTAITIVPGAPARVAFTTEPIGAAYSTPFATEPAVTIEDSLGNPVTTSSAAVSLTIATGTGAAGAVLACAGGNARAAVSGVASFAGCSINKSATGYRLTATATGLVASTSVSFDIGVASASRMAFLTQPTGAAVGAPFGSQPVVVIQDNGGNTVTSSAASVTLAISGGTGTPGASLSCASNPVSATNGVVAFSGCAIDKVGVGYTLIATAAGLTTSVSSAMTIAAGAPAALAFQPQPGGSAVGSLMSQQPVVRILDAGGNLVTSSTATVTLSIGTNPSGGTLTCTGSLSKAAVAGVATFAGCKVDRVGIGFTITAVAAGLTGMTSSPFDINAGAPQKLVFVTQPQGGQYATALPAQPQIAAVDALGNVVTSAAGTVILAVTPLTGASGATVTCTGGLSRPLSGGRAAFSGCAIDKPASGYTLTATMTGVTTAISTTFTITPGRASQLAFSLQPGGAGAGLAFTNQPRVTVLDASGNIVTGSSAVIALAITGGTGTPGATFSCTGSTSTVAAAGVATFAGCTIDLVGAGYTVTASSTTLASAISAGFPVAAGPPAKVAFSLQPAGASVGTAFATQPVVTIQDAGGNTVANSTASVTLSIATGTGAAGAALSCSGGLSKAAVNGIITFSGCQISKLGANYALKAASGTLTTATSIPLNVGPGAPSRLAVSTQPTGGPYGTAFPSQPVITIQDASGNTATQSNLTVTLAISAGTGAAGAALTCAGGPSVAATAGIAIFGGCSIDRAATGYTLTATAVGVTGVATASFTIGPGAPTRLGFSTQPAGATANMSFASQPAVTIQDAAGNTVTSSTLSVTLALTASTGRPGRSSIADRLPRRRQWRAWPRSRAARSTGRGPAIPSRPRQGR